MTRRDYLYLHFSGIISLLVSACKHEPEIKPEPEKPKVPPLKTLEISSIIPDEAIAGENLTVNFKAENIKNVKVELINKKIYALETNIIESTIGFYKFQLPMVFEKDSLFSIKLSGDGLESIKENIKTQDKIPPLKTIEILKIEPQEAIAEDMLGLFFKTENIKTVLIELRNKKGDLLEIRNVESEDGFYLLSLPGKFEPDDLLSIKITGDGVIVTKENIPTFNVLKINTEDYPELKMLGGFQKLSLTKGDIWLKRVATNEMKAFSGQCTHAGCGIDFLKSDNLFYCSCHGSKFSSDGLVLNGPASSPLNQYNCKFVKDGVFELIY